MVRRGIRLLLCIALMVIAVFLLSGASTGSPFASFAYHYNETLLPNGGSGAPGPRKTLFGGGARGGNAAPRTPNEDGIWRASPSRPPNSRCTTILWLVYRCSLRHGKSSEA